MALAQEFGHFALKLVSTSRRVLKHCLMAIAWIGYALESRCHLGKTIVYDTITKFKWSQALVHHPIAVVIDKVLAEDWEEGRPVPEAVPQLDCQVN
jgi:putative lipase involved disintegration of autophagic bodies